MTWIYHQSTGNLYKEGVLIESGYSGVFTNKNNPDREHVKGMGPIPRGSYRINGYTDHKGPFTINLEPQGTTHGRDSFRIHGERVNKPAGFASAGCIIMSNHTRRMVARSGDNQLEVVR